MIVSADGDPEGKTPAGPTAGEGGAGMKLEKKPCSSPSSGPACWYQCCLSSRACPYPPSLGLAPPVEGKSYLALQPKAAGLIPAVAVRERRPRWAAEGHVVISSPKPQAVPASVKCDLSWAPAGPSKQAIFMK